MVQIHTYTLYISTLSLDGLDENAYAAFQASRDLRDVIDRVLQGRKEGGKEGGGKTKLSVRAALMTPVLPMLVSETAREKLLQRLH